MALPSLQYTHMIMFVIQELDTWDQIHRHCLFGACTRDGCGGSDRLAGWLCAGFAVGFHPLLVCCGSGLARWLGPHVCGWRDPGTMLNGWLCKLHSLDGCLASTKGCNPSQGIKVLVKGCC
jgi:hypothetical protein